MIKIPTILMVIDVKYLPRRCCISPGDPAHRENLMGKLRGLRYHCRQKVGNQKVERTGQIPRLFGNSKVPSISPGNRRVLTVF